MDNQLPKNDEALVRPWPFFLLGVLLFILGLVLYFAQLQIPRYYTPWYLPILSTLGVLLMAVSAWQSRVVWRKIVLMLFVIVCGLEWFFFLELVKTPPYTGPAQVGQKLPTFVAARADGKAFTQNDLEKPGWDSKDRPKRTAVVFFRGRW